MNTMLLTNTPCGAEFNGWVRENSLAQNSTLAGCKVHFLFRNHAVDLETGRHGIKWLIARILTEAGAVAPRSEITAENRNLYIASSLTSEQIIAKVRETFGADRYPDLTIHQYLSVNMVRSGMVAKFRMTNSEDCNRNCKVPRNRFFLIAE